MPQRTLRVLSLLLVVLLAGGCYRSVRTTTTGLLSDATLRHHATGGALSFRRARVMTGNDTAFRSKLEIIHNARHRLDLIYYIFDDDDSSSVLAQALIAAARRGVAVRLLLDYNANYRRLDFLAMLEREGNRGDGSLQVRLYNRPTREIVLDAAWLTTGCPAHGNDRSAACVAEKRARIEPLFAAERIDGQLAARLRISNLDTGLSGLFLAGLYGKNPRLMAAAVRHGQGLDHGRRPLAERFPGLGELTLAQITGLDGEGRPAVRRVFAAYLPLDRLRSEAARRDWEYRTDYLHQKLIDADGRHVQLGGRNIGDHYHMRPNALADRYVFRDTDVRIDLDGGDGAFRRGFERLWNLCEMVATLDEVYRHAPIDYLLEPAALRQALAACRSPAGDVTSPCFQEQFRAHARPRALRLDRQLREMRRRARRYWQAYPYRRTPDPEPQFAVDAGARLYYIENVPFSGGPGALAARRSFGARNGAEARSGKRIHALWLLGLDSVCRQAARSGQPQRVVFHNAYFAPPANLIRKFGQMVDGQMNCPGVEVTILTNSLATTNLTPVNLLGRRSIQAFARYARAHRDPRRGARFRFFEYRRPAGVNRSLHSKVTVLGPDLMVGSANTDLRSYLMDANNALFIRRAPRLRAQYLAFVDGLLADPERTVERTGHYLALTPEQLDREDRRVLDAMVRRYRAQRWLSPRQIRLAEDQVLALLRLAGQLSSDILAGDEQAAARFDRLFKTI